MVWLLSGSQCCVHWVSNAGHSDGFSSQSTSCHGELTAGFLCKRHIKIERCIIDQTVYWWEDPELSHISNRCSQGLGDRNQPQVSPSVVTLQEQLHSPPASPQLCVSCGLGFLCCITWRHSTGVHHSFLSPGVWQKQIIAASKMVSTGLLPLREANHKRVNWN